MALDRDLTWVHQLMFHQSSLLEDKEEKLCSTQTQGFDCLGFTTIYLMTKLLRTEKVKYVFVWSVYGGSGA